MKTGLFAVFDSQKSKDRTAGPVFSSLGPVWLRSFCGLETGLTNTNGNLDLLNIALDPSSSLSAMRLEDDDTTICIYYQDQ